MEIDEKIQAHVLSVWRETVDFFSVWGREGMLILTDKHLMFITKTEAGMKWWGALRTRQLVKLHADDNVMITHDGYDEEKLRRDLENKKNHETRFDDIFEISFEDKKWGDVLLLEVLEKGKKKKYQFGVARDWVKYPMKEPTKYMKVDWSGFVKYIKDRQKITK